jgi:hypothetical protein
LTPCTDEGSEKLALDPRGRLAFFAQTGREVNEMTVLDFRSGKQSEAFHYGSAGDHAPTVELLTGRWLPGRYPVWETLEKTTEDSGAVKWKAYRVYTVPGARKLEVATGRRKPHARLMVAEDGKTLVQAKGELPLPGDTGPCKGCDPTGRFLGIGKDTLRGVADAAELTFGPDDCVHTPQGVFDCKPEYAHTLVFRLGDDAASAPLYLGDRIAKLLFHPKLVEDFFSGASVAPPPELARWRPEP